MTPAERIAAGLRAPPTNSDLFLAAAAILEPATPVESAVVDAILELAAQEPRLLDYVSADRTPPPEIRPRAIALGTLLGVLAAARGFSW